MENHPGAREELASLGFRSVPVTVVPGHPGIAGFRPRELSDTLGLGLAPAPRDPAETIPLLERLLEAVELAVRQMPDERLNYRAPDRDRPMGEFAYHIFARVQAVMRTLGSGAAPPPNLDDLDRPGRAHKTFGAIADFGRGVREEYAAWQSSPRRPSLVAPIAAEQLDLLAGHTTQHLRQLYFVLEQFGIPPRDPIPDDQFPPEYVLTILW